jgi:hypothetical protein
MAFVGIGVMAAVTAGCPDKFLDPGRFTWMLDSSSPQSRLRKNKGMTIPGICKPELMRISFDYFALNIIFQLPGCQSVPGIACLSTVCLFRIVTKKRTFL